MIRFACYSLLLAGMLALATPFIVETAIATDSGSKKTTAPNQAQGHHLVATYWRQGVREVGLQF